MPRGSIAYASQDAFLWPTSVRENIVLHQDFDPAWYAIVLDACCLGSDLARMEKGDMTGMAESGGMSGGQRQRIVSAFMACFRVGLNFKPCCRLWLGLSTQNATSRSSMIPFRLW